MSNIIGIDLGTTNTCVAILDGSQPRVLENSEGNRTTPSMVAFTAKGSRLVGQAAKRQMVTNPENTLLAIKRLMGRRYGDPSAQDFQGRVAFGVVEGENGDAWAEVGGRQMSPSEISAIVLQKMKQTAEAFLGEEVTQAVITVPAYFNDAQRQATRDAGRIAGLEVLRIVNEPTAAALAYGLDKADGQVIAVYDLGGGTFDISILEINNGVFHVKATNGDTYLGGVDFDQCVMNDIVETFEREQGIDLRQNRLAMQRIREAAEQARIELSGVQQTDINLPFIHADEEGPRHLSQNFSRSRLETLVDDLIQRTVGPCQTALQDAGIPASAVDEVILVGGMTRMPKVQETVARLFGREPHRGVNPDEVVAMGAAVQGGVLSGALDHILLLDVTPFSLGIRTKGGGFSPLIQKNEPIPCQMAKTFTTVQNWQTRVTVMVAQGEDALFENNTFLGEFELEGLPLALRGTPRIEVTFSVDVDGMVQVAARDQESGLKQSLRVKIAGGLAEDEVQRLTEEAEVQAQEEARTQASLAISNKAEALLECSSQLLCDHGANLGSDLLQNMEGFMTDLRATMQADKERPLSGNIERMVSLTETLQSWYGQAMQTVRQQEVLALESHLPHEGQEGATGSVTEGLAEEDPAQTETVADHAAFSETGGWDDLLGDLPVSLEPGSETVDEGSAMEEQSANAEEEEWLALAS